MRTQPGFTLIETIITIFILGVVSGIFASSMYVTRAFKRANQIVEVDLFLATALDQFEHAYTESCACQIGGDLIGMAFNVGRARVSQGTNPPSGTQVLRMFPVEVPLVQGITSLSLLKEVYTDVDFSAGLRVDPSSETGWEAGFVLGYQDADNYHRILLDDGGLNLERVSEGNVVSVATYSTTVAPGSWVNLQVTRLGDQVDITLDGTNVISASDAYVNDGHVGIVGFGETLIEADDFVVGSSGGFSEDFEDEILGEMPDMLMDIAPYDLKNFTPRLTISEFDGSPDLLKVSAVATWTEEGHSKSRKLMTVMFIE